MELLFALLPVLLIGSPLFFIAYKYAVKKKGGVVNQRMVLSVAIVMFIVIPALFFLSVPRSSILKEVPISDVIRRANNREIEKIEIRNDELEITKRGQAKPTERSRKESGSSIYEQGLNKDTQVQIEIKN